MEGVVFVVIVLQLASQPYFFVQVVNVIRLRSVSESHGKLLYLGWVVEQAVEKFDGILFFPVIL